MMEVLKLFGSGTDGRYPKMQSLSISAINIKGLLIYGQSFKYPYPSIRTLQFRNNKNYNHQIIGH